MYVIIKHSQKKSTPWRNENTKIDDDDDVNNNNNNNKKNVCVYTNKMAKQRKVIVRTCIIIIFSVYLMYIT